VVCERVVEWMLHLEWTEDEEELVLVMEPGIVDAMRDSRFGVST
jgi:hypothetical protein